MSDPRLYRMALVPVFLALVLLAFSLENRPRPLTTALAPDAFEGDRAFERAYGSGRRPRRPLRRSQARLDG